MTVYEDHFSRSAAEYLRFRPRYPESLYTFLAQLTSGREVAWDCGTGSGQAATRLAEVFERVVATDISVEQLGLADRHPRVEYRRESAERVALPDRSVDLVTVAAAVHWFDLDGFYAEVRRVLRPGGAIAVWAYHLPTISPEIDRLLRHYSENVLQSDWPIRSRYVLDGYRSLPFPFVEVPVPELAVEIEWTMAELAGFIGSWSAAVAHVKRTGHDPVDSIRAGLRDAWGEAPTRRVRCPLFARAGRLLDPIPSSTP